MASANASAADVAVVVDADTDADASVCDSATLLSFSSLLCVVVVVDAVDAVTAVASIGALFIVFTVLPLLVVVVVVMTAAAALAVPVPPPNGSVGFAVDVDVDVDVEAEAEAEADADADADADPNVAMMAEMLATISCPSIQPFCGMGGDLGPFIQQLCPVTCGYCDEGDGDAENPRNPTKYRATSILYHAHLLGAEMYATLLRPTTTTTTTNEEEEEDRAEHDNDDGGGVSSSSSMTQQQRASSMNATTTMIVKDLQSSEFWNFDNQVATPMENDYEIQVVTSSKNSEQEEQGPTMTTTEFIKGVEIVPGDHIQATCVYNSMYRDTSTQFGLSTYDEMCLIFLQITFPTPVDLINNNNNNDLGSLSLTADLNLRTFSCGVMEEEKEEEEDSEQSDNTEESAPAETTDTDTASTTQPTTTKKTVVFSDVWQGILESEEDPRNIWVDHPITSTEMCTFPVADYVVLEFMTFESRNCPLSMNTTTTHDFDSSSVCYGFETTTTKGDNNSDGSDGVDFLTETIAGYTCVGGIYDQKDSNEPPLYLTKEECLSQESGGTSYEAYTCADIQDWLRYEATMWGITDEVKEFVRTEWYQPKCCRESSDGDDNGDSDIDNTSVCSGLNTEGGDTTVEFLMDTIAGYKCVGGSYDDKDSNEPPLLLSEEECLVGGGGSSYNAYTCKGIQKWLQKEETSVTNDIKEYLKINWYQPTCCRVVRESDSNGDSDSDSDSEPSTAADTTTTISIAAADESSSSSSSTSSVAIVLATASVVIIIMMTTTTTMMVL
eukprot:CAMPEP_0170841154 /NCGR_PEP_ID=MMETSP0734-20130129/5005_1 /TAXON_ID=186038 /ORGANISM="Fragilariopsis kerguelensis, Strain L26-C5" /LENGTH=779 /DNA_ID=CAMNT_0011209101 /DNA_START=2290 /DNA_END=4629 /DNA_ORIENTATION=-